jgi:hypothetical protein
LAILNNPLIIKDLLSNDDYNKLLISIGDPKRFEYSSTFSRYISGEASLPILKELANKLVPFAREIFKSNGLMPTYTLFSHYEGNPSLFKHKDDNACTYTLDMCLYQSKPWGLFVDNKEYILKPNEALAYYGNDQDHWREDFPNDKNDFVAMVFFHFAEPDHWYFTKGSSYHQVIIGKKTEEQWKIENDLSSII